MKKLKVCFTERNNLGDSINPYIFKQVLNVDIVYASATSCEVTGIGSGLRRFYREANSLGAVKNILLGRLNGRKLKIWSAGFLTTPKCDEISVRRNVDLISVRGELSREYIAKITKKDVTCSTGDGGLLCSELIDNTRPKRYSVGIIPHDKDRFDPLVMEIGKKVSDSVIIDVRGDVIDTLNKIAECESIVSSSLHGLIIADSFNIPNMHIKISDRLSGDGFKFNDYYSVYGLCDECYEVNSDINPEDITESRIKELYRLDKGRINTKKEEIKSALIEATQKD